MSPRQFWMRQSPRSPCTPTAPGLPGAGRCACQPASSGWWSTGCRSACTPTRCGSAGGDRRPCSGSTWCAAIMPVLPMRPPRRWSNAAVRQERADFLAALSRRAGRTYADALASGGVLPADLAAFTEALAEQASDVRTRRRALAERRDQLRDEVAAITRQMSGIQAQRDPDRMAAVVSLDVSAEAEAEVELELTYVVDGAGWQPTYDIRLDSDRLALTWYALVSQRTGEDWPECELLLSTARPSGAVTVPELGPWYLDRIRPAFDGAFPAGAAFEMAMPTRAAPPPAAAMPAEDLARAPLQEAGATVEQGIAAATYRPARPVAVPADGGQHRATVAVLDLAATLDYITAPVRSPEAHLRATAVNTSAHALLPGRAAV